MVETLTTKLRQTNLLAEREREREKEREREREWMNERTNEWMDENDFRIIMVTFILKAASVWLIQYF